MSDPVAKAIGELCRKAKSSMVDSVQYLVDAGKKLQTKKGTLAHGEWLPWLKDNADVLGFGNKQAERLLKAAKYDVNVVYDENKAIQFSRQIWGNAPKEGATVKRRKPHETRAVEEMTAASMVLDEGKTIEQAATETGLDSVQIVKTAIAREEGRREAKADPEIDITALSMTVQQKMEAWKRQQLRAMELNFEQRVRDECRKRIEETILPSYNKTHAEYQSIIKTRKGLMDRATYNKIRNCLHPDRIAFLNDERLTQQYGEAFRIFNKIELLLLDENQHPTTEFQMPTTFAEMMALKEKVAAERRAKRKGRNTVTLGG